MAPIATLPPAENPPPAGSGTPTEDLLSWMPSRELEEVKQQMAHLEALLNSTQASERIPLLKQWVSLRSRMRQLQVLEAPAKNDEMTKRKALKATEERRRLRLSKFKETFRVVRSRHEALERMKAEVERLQIIYIIAVRNEKNSIQSDYDLLSQAYDNVNKHKQALRVAEDQYMALGTADDGNS